MEPKGKPMRTTRTGKLVPPYQSPRVVPEGGRVVARKREWKPPVAPRVWTAGAIRKARSGGEGGEG